MNKTTKDRARNKNPIYHKTIKTGPGRTLNVLDPKYRAIGSIKAPGKTPLAAAGKRRSGARDRTTLALLRQYFVLRIALSRGYAGGTGT